MPNKMERFTQGARRALSLAQEEAERLQSGYIGPEHILLALLRQEDEIAGKVLNDLGVEYQAVLALVEKLPKPLTRFDAPLDLSPLTKKLLEHSVDEARRMGHDIGTEHLLLGLARLPENQAAAILSQFGVRAEEVRRQIRRVLQGDVPSSTVSERQSATWVSPVAPPRASGLLQGIFGSAYSRSVPEQSRILDMIEQGKITADEGAKLLSALPSPVRMAQVMSPEMVSQFYRWRGGEERQLRLRITDKSTGDLKAELTVSTKLVESGVLGLLSAFVDAKTGKIGELDADPNARIELFIDDDEQTGDPSSE